LGDIGPSQGKESSGEQQAACHLGSLPG
jgi:hypothetical protein